MDKKTVTEKIAEKLTDFNETITEEGVEVRAFYVDWDDDFENWVSHTIFVIDDSKKAENQGRSRYRDFVDRYCSAAGNALDEFCAFNYCLFRTESEYQEDFRGEWSPTAFNDLKDAA